ncbi:MAG: 6-phosphogluconolactonase [Spirochaetaceae bacterium]|nr:6-phosphogluconolactonase [Spirochaetaceae bacterium]
MMKAKTMRIDTLWVEAYQNRSAAGRAAADACEGFIKTLFNKKESINIIFAAAPSQNEFLLALSEKDIDFSRINAYHMDEYIGLAAGDPRLFAHYLNEHIFQKRKFRSVNMIDTTVGGAAACRAYDELLKQNPPDIVCMGIGENGHIAFNDPPYARFDDPEFVRIVKLDEASRIQQVNDKCFARLDEVPREAVTLTIPRLMSARFIVCTVPGALKADAVRCTLYNEIGESCPASILRCHQDATLFLDADSAKWVVWHDKGTGILSAEGGR